MATTTPNNLDAAAALARFADAGTSPEDRREALSALSATKVLPKQADDPAIEAGRRHLVDQARTAEKPGYRLLAIAECIRLTQIVNRWTPVMLDQLRPAFAEPLPNMQLLTNGNDKLNLARACAQISAPWLPDYLARSIVEEPAADKARAEMVVALLERSNSLAQTLQRLATAFEAFRPDTQAPGDTMARRQARTLEVLREALLDSEIEAGDDLGVALHECVSAPLATVGKPQEDKAQIDLCRQVLLLVHDIVRTRISVVADPTMYRVVDYCRRLSGGRSWPDELKKPLERLITDVTEALLLLGRQGQRDQALLAQLDVLCNNSDRARAVARELAARHPELNEEVRDWLEHGRVRTVRRASESAIEAAASSADESIGLSLQAARKARLLRDTLREPLVSSLEVYDPGLAPAAQELLDSVQALAVQVEQAAALRGLELYGTPGEEVEMSTKLFIMVGGVPRQRMLVKQPAIVRKRTDGGVGDVVTKGLVE
ncbi:MAG: hypothetical protein KIT86_03370 [Hydrogenophaga sp.]|uniref:hypothetical protein n=1 Tax=Hydrogenophaga sp. TaxID=1904254 RepID=UPI002616CE1F|nr:hypothetical protein [Hydrogenophaga sp.]MCW5668675.1 hypothetical protein [Hydrogenophaga sp.]